MCAGVGVAGAAAHEKPPVALQAASPRMLSLLRARMPQRAVTADMGLSVSVSVIVGRDRSLAP